MNRPTKFVVLSALATGAVLLLAAVEAWIPEHGWWRFVPLGALHYILHHFAALVGGASIVGIVFELWVRREMVAEVKTEVKKAFLDNPDVSTLFADEQREKWVKNILAAQMPSDPSLSDAVFADVVRPFMSRRRFRSELNYTIRFLKEPPGGWTLDSIKARPDEYMWLSIQYNITQHLPAPLPRANIAIIVQNAFEELRVAFDDPTCFYRDSLVLHAEDSHAVIDQLDSLAREGKQGQSSLGDIAAELVVDGHRVQNARPDFDKSKGVLRFHYELPASEKVDLKIKVDAPYLVTAGHYPVIYGEPTAKPTVDFYPGPCAKPQEVNVIHLLQGTRELPPEVTYRSDSVGVSFPESDSKTRWVLPMSGLVFLWHHQRPIPVAAAGGTPLAPRPIRPPSQPRRRSSGGG